MNIPRKLQHAVEHVPFVGIVLIAAIFSMRAITLVSVLGMALHLLEVTSVYNRLLPGVSVWHYWLAGGLAILIELLLTKCLPQYPRGHIPDYPSPIQEAKHDHPPAI